MRRRSLGASGLEVSELSFGAMTFGEGMEPLSTVPGDREAGRLVGMALDAGVNLFDTADVYGLGRSEEMLGRALGARREEALIVTKVGFPIGSGPESRGLSGPRIAASVEASLRRLGTDRIDLYLIHKRDVRTPFEETAAALDRLVQRGLVRCVGFCNLEAWEAALAVGLQRERGFSEFCCAQMYYSLVGRDVEEDVLPFLQKAGLGMMVWSPLAAGFLTGKYGEQGGGDDTRRRDAYAYPPVDPVRGAAVLDAVREVAEGRGASCAQIALAWVRARPGVSTVVLGASSAAQLEENLAAGQIDLEPEEVARLDAAGELERRYPRAFYDHFPED